MKLGRYAAGVLYQMLHNESPGFREFRDIESSIDKNSLKILNLDKNIPKNFEQFLM